MIFRGTKKLKRDRKLGLVFRWSGSYATNRGGMTLALLGAVGMFSLMFFGLQLEVNSAKALSSHQPRLVLYDGSDEKLNRWIEMQPPRLPRWSREGEMGKQRVADMLTKSVDKSNAESLDWRKGDYKTKQTQPTPRALAGIRELPPVSRHQFSTPKVELKDVEWLVEIKVEGSLQARMIEQQEFKHPIPEQWNGKTISFLITVNQTGEIENCAPLKLNGEEGVLQFENWVRTLKFKPSKKLFQQGIVRLHVIEKLETKEGETDD